MTVGFGFICNREQRNSKFCNTIKDTSFLGIYFTTIWSYTTVVPASVLGKNIKWFTALEKKQYIVLLFNCKWKWSKLYRDQQNIPLKDCQVLLVFYLKKTLQNPHSTFDPGHCHLLMLAETKYALQRDHQVYPAVIHKGTFSWLAYT